MPPPPIRRVFDILIFRAEDRVRQGRCAWVKTPRAVSGSRAPTPEVVEHWRAERVQEAAAMENTMSCHQRPASRAIQVAPEARRPEASLVLIRILAP
jgi:hypothetical protein